MPETEPKLGYRHGVLERLRAQHEHMSREELIDLVCTLTKEYVLDQTIPFDFPLPERADELRSDAPYAPASPNPEDDRPTDDVPEERRFARLILGLKGRTKLPQFEGFSEEDGKAVLVVDNQKVVFGERVTVALFSRRRNRRGTDSHRQVEEVSEPPTPTPREPARPTPAPAPAQGARRAPAPEPDDDIDDDSGVERFRGLDLD